MRKTIFAPGEYYHLCGRGNEKQKLFLDIRDYVRFLFLILYFQSPIIVNNISSIISNFVKHKKFNLSDKTKNKITRNRTVELVSFSIMPNHFHLIVRELEEGGISKYMQKVLMAYAKYFNEKYEKSGHVFQGPFKAIHIEDDSQLLYTSAYIHRNPRKLKEWKNKEHLYPWSSYQDCLEENRWDEFLNTDIISARFRTPNDYKKMVEESGAKEDLRNIENMN
jgi:putative transposase